jgi:site-specific DNA-methyltransferase (adenine-specific)
MTSIQKQFDPQKLILPKDFKPDPAQLTNMVNSIRDEGLLHPPLVKSTGEVFAGKLRVSASRVCQLKLIDCKEFPSDLPEEEYTIISLHENLKRFNLPWYEQVLREKELHELRQIQEGKAAPGKKVGWSLRDTAKELNMAFGILSEDLRIAEAIAADPSLKKIEDKTHAKKVIFERLKRSNQEIAASVPAPIETNVVLQGSSEVVLQGFPNNIFDVCITDPPWLEFKDSSMRRDEFTLPVFKEIYRVLKMNSFLYSFVSTQDWLFYQEKLTEFGFTVQKWPLIWIKEGVLTYGSRSWEYQRDYEPILLAAKGSPSLTAGMQSSIISCKVVPSGKMIHPNEKPADVIKRLLDSCSYEGALVLDPFAGSGIVPVVAKQMRRRFVAVEREPKYFAGILERLKENKT